MIARIDILNLHGDGPISKNWANTMKEKIENPGFQGAMLYRVYRRMNQQGYSFVSISRWENLAAFHETERASTSLTFGEYTSRTANLYGRVDASPRHQKPVSSDHLIVTNPYRIDKTAEIENARMWNATKNMMEGRDGFLDAELFQSFDPDSDEYYFVSQARWETEKSFLEQFSGKDYKSIVSSFEGTFQICFCHLEEQVSASS